MREAPTSDCPEESRTAGAVSAGYLPDDIALHLAGCATCREAYSTAGKMQQLATVLYEEPACSAAGMWWRLKSRMRHERAHQAQKPLVWMGRIFYLAATVTAASALTAIPGLSGRTATIALAGLSAVALPVAIALLGWARSKA